MKFIETHGLSTTDLKPKGSVPIYLSDDYEVLEGPTYWAMKIAQTRSRSMDTLKEYTTVLAKYLQWRDDEDYKAEYWLNTDEDVIYQYINFLIDERNDKGKPSDSTIEYYIARLQSFYTWARDKGYTHYWEMNMKKVVRTIENRTMVDIQVKRDARSIHIQNGKSTHVDSEMDKFIHRENIPKILELFDDEVYAFIAVVLWQTGLRPKDFFQLPYKGTALNSGFKRYREEELDNIESIPFEFESKGKRRSIKFPGELWAVICRAWMPKRAERATLYREKHGVMPPNSALFLSKNGTIITRKMLRDNLMKVAEKNECPEKRLTPCMFRHGFATYFVLDKLEHFNLLGKTYVYNAVIDQSLREWMGHTDVGTTYSYYVHLISRYNYNDLLDDIKKNKDKEVLNILEKI